MATVPDDWNLKAVGAPEAWAPLTRSGEPRDIPWNGVEVAHLDIGWINHPVFGPKSNTWVEVGNGRNLMEPVGKPEYPLNPKALYAGHGTRTMSVLCGDTKADR